MKQEAMRLMSYDVLCMAATRYQQLDFVSSSLLARARKHDHLPALVAQLASHAEAEYNSTQLVGVATQHMQCFTLCIMHTAAIKPA